MSPLPRKKTPEEPTIRRLVGYIRVSSVRQRDEGLSADVQERKLQEYASLHGVELVAIERDEAKSGGKLNRPGLRRALDMLKKGKANGLVAVKLDRVTRSVRDLGDLLDKYFGPHCPFELVAILDSIDTSTASGRMVANVLMSVSQWEREVAAERTLVVRSAKMEAGEYVGGEAPFGWRITKRKGTKMLEKDDEEQKIIAIVKAWRAQELTLQKIVDRLEVEGVRRRKGKPWTRQTVWRLLAV